MGPIVLLVASFHGSKRADQVLDDLREMDRDDKISILNSVVIRKDEAGKVSASEDADVSAGGGALFGALVGAIVGFLGGPGGAVVGAAAGALTGGITAAGIDLGFPNETLQEIQDSLKPDSSAILALVEEEWRERVTGEIHHREGRVIHQAPHTEITRRMLKDRNKD